MIKKNLLAALCCALLSACALPLDQLFQIPSATPSLTATETQVPTITPSETPTIPTPTFSATPTLSGQKTDTATPDFTPTDSTFTPLPLYTPPTSTPPLNTVGFVTVNVSVHEFFKHGVCQPQSVKFTAQAAKPADTKFVVLFVRFKSKITKTTSAWTSFTMQSIGAGTFVQEVFGADMKGVDSFDNSWVEFQFVATDSKSQETGRTGIVSDQLTLWNCVPTATPAPSATPTILKP